MIRVFCLLLLVALLSGVTSRTSNENELTDEELADLEPLPLVSSEPEDKSYRVGAARYEGIGHRCWHLEPWEGQCVCCGIFFLKRCLSPAGSVDKCSLYAKNLLLVEKAERKSFTFPANFPLPTDPTVTVPTV